MTITTRRMHQGWLRATLVALLTMLAANAWADGLAVIVHPSNDAALDAQAVSRIFLGKAKSFPGGKEAVPVDQSVGNGVRETFGKKILKKSPSQLKAYWSKLVFTGKGSPPKESDNDAAVIALVAENPNLIGYVAAAPTDGSVRVALSVD